MSVEKRRPDFVPGARSPSSLILDCPQKMPDFKPKSLFFVKPSLNTLVYSSLEGCPLIILVNLQVDHRKPV